MSTTTGAFDGILKRNNKQIRDDRAQAIVEDAELEMKRMMENLERDIKKMKRKREAMLDLSPGNSYSLTPEKFDASLWVDKDVELGIEIRNTEIKYNIVKERYEYLFGKPVEVTSSGASDEEK
jgi:hypothetical protein